MIKFLLFFCFLWYGVGACSFLYGADYRVVSLSPSITETLYDLQLGEFLVGTVELPKEPLFANMAKGVRRVGAYQNPNVEAILALNPTHVLTLKEGPDNVSARLKSHLRVFRYKNSRLSKAVKTIG